MEDHNHQYSYTPDIQKLINPNYTGDTNQSYVKFSASSEESIEMVVDPSVKERKNNKYRTRIIFVILVSTIIILAGLNIFHIIRWDKLTLELNRLRLTTSQKIVPANFSGPSPAPKANAKDVPWPAYEAFLARLNRSHSQPGWENYWVNSFHFNKVGEKNQEMELGDTKFAEMNIDQMRALVEPRVDPIVNTKTRRCDIYKYAGSKRYIQYIIGSSIFNSTDRLPVRLNYTQFLHSVKDQGSRCNTGYAYATTTLMEVDFETPVELSVQSLLTDYNNHGCDGGSVFQAMTTAYLEGLARAEDLPKDEQKLWRDEEFNGTHTTGYTPCVIVGSSVEAKMYKLEESKLTANYFIKTVLAHYGAVVVEIPVDRSFFLYKSGIYRPNCTEIIGYQPAVITGYGRKDNVDVWYLRNSFGTDWGINGDIIVAQMPNAPQHCRTFAHGFAFL